MKFIWIEFATVPMVTAVISAGRPVILACTTMIVHGQCSITDGISTPGSSARMKDFPN